MPDTLNLRFPGQYFDEETGLHYNYFRDYEAHTGRYVQSDPIGLPGGINTYVYAHPNLLTRADPTGLKVLIVGHLAAGALGRLTNPNSYHLALYLDPDDKCNCEGSWPKTLGAQRDKGMLVEHTNYPGDAIEHATFTQVVPAPEGMTDCQFINALIDSAGAYKNDQPYGFPHIGWMPGMRDGSMDAGSYNSNSFVAGTLLRAGSQPPPLNTGGLFQAPGYGNPVP